MNKWVVPLLFGAGLVFGQTVPTEKHFLWKAWDKDSEIWLLGSIHMAPKGLYPLPKVMEEAFLATSEVAVELNISADSTMMQVAQSMMLHGVYPKGDGLAQHVSKKTIARLDSFFVAKGIPFESMQTLKPWLLALRIGTLVIGDAGAEAEQGIDLHFIDQAGTAKKNIVALETAGQQMELFQSLPDSLQETMLDWTLDEAQNMTSLLDSMFSIWKRGDIDAMEKFVLQDQEKDPRFKAFFQRLYTDRNRGMAAKAEGFLKTNRKVLVVVGRAHLVGAEGVPAILRKKGFQVEQW